MRARTALPGRLSAVVALLFAAFGCDCGETGLKKGGPTIQVEPAEVSIDGIPSKVTEVALKVSNVGGGLLTFDPAPAVVEADGDADVEYAVPEAGRFTYTCDHAERDPARGLGPGDCALLLLRYLPARNGLDEAVLHIYNSDPDSPDLAVPIHGNAQTPAIEVCAYDGQSEVGCSVDTEFDVDFGISPPGTETRRTLKVFSQGSRSLVVSRPVLQGDADFQADLAQFANETTTMEAATEKAIELTFNAVTGGRRAATLTIASNAPGMSPLHVNLGAVGDGPRLCLSAQTLDFGPVPVGGTLEKTLKLASCGTKPVELKTLALADSAGIFAATLPTLPRTLETGSTPIDVPVRFSPAAPDRYQGRLNFLTDTEQGYVALQGMGVESGCKLESASAVLDFGQVQIGVQARRDYTLANHGTKDCVLADAPVIAVGAAAAFALAGVPPPGTIVGPGNVTRITVSYTPADASPDAGRMDVFYAENTPGAAPQTLQVALKGTPAAEPKCIVTVQPRAASSVNFGQVRLWSEKVLPFTFQNTGSMNCTLSGWRISESIVSGNTGGYKIKTPPKNTLVPGETTTAEIAFTPKTEGLYGTPMPGFPGGGSMGGSKFMVNTSDTASFAGTACMTFSFPPTTGAPGCVGWDLTGEGVQGALQILPYDVNFGLVTLGCRSREQTLTLYNVGQAVINVQEIKIDPAPAAGQPPIFTFTAPPTPFAIPGGGREQVKVRYRPPDSGVHTASLMVKSDATNSAAGNPWMTVGLKGEGTTNSHQTDVFDQSARPKSDVLFIVDNSGSMSEEQNALAANAQTFLSTATSLNSDFQLGVVTVDMEAAADSGNLKGNPKIIVPGPNAASQFSAAVKRGTNGSGTEKGLAAMHAALSPPLITDPNLNGGFLRADAKLAVIVISDEDDQSSGTVMFYTDFLKSLKGQYNAGLVSLSAVVGDPAPGTNSSGSNGCTSSNGDAVSGDRYIAVQQATGGKFRSICSSNWGQIASDLGLDAFGTRAGYPLSRVPDLSQPMTVTVNGSASTPPAWSYDGPSNAVVFGATSLPPPGARVVVDYETACL